MKMKRYALLSIENHVIDLFLHYKSALPKTLKGNIPYSQALRIKRICSETSEVITHLKDLKDAFIKKSYQSKILDHHFERANSADRKIL